MKLRSAAVAVLGLIGIAVLGYATGWLYRSPVVINLSKEVVEHATPSKPFFFEPKPGVRFEREPLPEWLPEPLTKHTNRDTLLAEREFAIPKPAGVFRIAVLGDSWAYGLYINTNKTFPTVLEQIFRDNEMCNKQPSVEVLNFGVPGYDIEMSVERYRARAAQYEPDLVVWVLSTTDFEQLAAYVDQHTPHPSSPTNVVRILEKQWREYGVAGMHTAIKDALLSIDQYYTGPLVLTYFPFHTSAQTRTIAPLLYEVEEERPHTFVHLSPLPWKEQYLLPDYHPNELGHSFIAGSLFSYLLGTHLVPCTPPSR